MTTATTTTAAPATPPPSGPLDSFTAWLKSIPGAVAARFKRGTPEAFKRNLRMAAAKSRLVDLSDAAERASIGDQADALRTHREILEGQVAALTDELAAGEARIMADCAWLSRLCNGTLAEGEPKFADTPFRQQLVEAVQEGVAAKIRNVGLPCSMFTSGSDPNAKAAAPVITPQSGRYPGSVLCEMSSATPHVVIRYTRDGKDPDVTSEPYVGPFEVAKTTTIKARSFCEQLKDSDVSTAIYTINR